MKKVEDRGPIKEITHKGSTVFIYHTPTQKNGKDYDSFTLVYTQAGQRKRKVVANRAKAEETAKAIAKQLSEGTAHVVTLTPEEIADYTAALKILRKYPSTPLASVCQQYAEAMDRLETHGSTIMDAVLTHLAQKKKTAPSEIKVSLLLDEYMAAKEQEHLSTYYLKDLRRKLSRFASSFLCSISSINSREVKTWISKQGNGRNAQNLHTSVSSFLSYAREMGHLPSNEKHAGEMIKKVKVKPSSIGIYSPDDLVKILAHTPEPLIPSIAIAAFAGLRSAELFRLDWSEIKMDQGHIEVTAEKAKTASRRLVPILPCLSQWLSTRKKTTGRVTPELSNLDNLTRKYSAICGKAGVVSHRNGFRHSFASYRMAAEKSAAQVALEMGNSPAKLFSNYRELVTETNAKAWFNVTPTKVKRAKKGKTADS
jgi:integrase